LNTVKEELTYGNLINIFYSGYSWSIDYVSLDELWGGLQGNRMWEYPFRQSGFLFGGQEVEIFSVLPYPFYGDEFLTTKVLHFCHSEGAGRPKNTILKDFLIL